MLNSSNELKKLSKLVGSMSNCFTKEWQVYQHSRSCVSKDVIRAVEDVVIRAFGAEVPEGLVLRTIVNPQYMALLEIELEYVQKHRPGDNGNIESSTVHSRQIMSGPSNSLISEIHRSPSKRRSRISVKMGHAPLSITFLQGSSGGSS